MFPVALLSGILFPSIAAEVQASVGDRMNSTGITTLLNTTGAAIGPLVASFVLLPALGYQTSLICCAAGVCFAQHHSLDRTRSSGRCAGQLGSSLVTLWVALILGLVFFPYDAPKRISNMRAVHTKGTIRAKCWRAL